MLSINILKCSSSFLSSYHKRRFLVTPFFHYYVIPFLFMLVLFLAFLFSTFKVFLAYYFWTIPILMLYLRSQFWHSSIYSFSYFFRVRPSLFVINFKFFCSLYWSVYHHFRFPCDLFVPSYNIFDRCHTLIHPFLISISILLFLSNTIPRHLTILTHFIHPFANLHLYPFRQSRTWYFHSWSLVSKYHKISLIFLSYMISHPHSLLSTFSHQQNFLQTYSFL